MSAIKKITFETLGINAAYFNGMKYDYARKIAINIAIDWLAWHQFAGISEPDFPVNYDKSEINFVDNTVDICIELVIS